MTLAELDQVIAGRILAAQQEIATLTAARDALRAQDVDGQPAPSRRRRRTAGSVEGVDVVQLLQNTPDGLSTPKLASAFGVTPAVMRVSLQELESENAVVRVGARRTARWQLVTD